MSSFSVMRLGKCNYIFMKFAYVALSYTWEICGPTLYILQTYEFTNIIVDALKHVFSGDQRDTVMSDSGDSTITYTKVSSPFEDLSDIGSPGLDGLPIMPQDPYAYVEAALQAPPSPDYVPSPEQPPSPAYVPEFVPEHVYLEFMPPKDNVLLAEVKPLPAAVSSIVDSAGYIPESDPEEDDEDPEEDPVDYPIDREEDDEDEKDSFEDDVMMRRRMGTRIKRRRRSTQL
nr:hypothetical protein [Tanacetum cinerariifolium]